MCVLVTNELQREEAFKKGMTLEKYLYEIAKLLSKLKKYKPIRNKFPNEALPKDGYILDYVLDAKRLFRQLNGNILPNRPLNFVITKGGDLKIGIKHHLSGRYKPTPEQASVLKAF